LEGMRECTLEFSGEGTMPLSDHEQRVLDELAQRLAMDDSEFGHRIGPGHARLRFTMGLIGLAAGLGLLVLFCVSTQVIAGIASFLLMFGSLYLLWLSFAKAAQRALADTGIRLKPDGRPRPGRRRHQDWE
jgi:hypothetical protein